MSRAQTLSQFPSGLSSDASGNLNLLLSGASIRGDMSNATPSNRMMLQTSTANTWTSVGAKPNGTGTAAYFQAYNSSDPNNASYLYFGITASTASISTTKLGTGTNLPLVIGVAGTEVMRMDTSANVGIGTSAPGYKLHVVGDGNFARSTATDTFIQASNSVATFNITQSANGSTYLYNYGAYNLYFGTGATTKMTLDSSGNLGLGVTPSAWHSIYKTAQFGSGASISGRTDNSTWLEIDANCYRANDGYWKALYSGVSSRYQQDSGVHSWYTAGSTTAGTAIAFTQSMTLNASGQLALGTTTVTNAILNIGNPSSGSVPFMSIIAPSNNTEIAYMQFNQSDDMFSIWNKQGYSGSGIRFGTNNTERARIDVSGNLLIGTTTARDSGTRSVAITGVGVAASLDLTSTLTGGRSYAIYTSGSTSNGIQFYDLTAGAERARIDSSGNLLVGQTTGEIASRIVSKTGTSDNSSNALLLKNSSNTYLAQIRSDGYWYGGFYSYTTASAANVTILSGGDIVRSTSALKYKQDIRDLESIDVDKFRPVRYKSKCESDDPTKDYFGIIADEVDAAGIKELVNYGADGEVEGFQYERLTVVLLKEIQSLRTRLAAAGIA